MNFVFSLFPVSTYWILSNIIGFVNKKNKMPYSLSKHLKCCEFQGLNCFYVLKIRLNDMSWTLKDRKYCHFWSFFSHAVLIVLFQCVVSFRDGITNVLLLFIRLLIECRSCMKMSEIKSHWRLLYYFIAYSSSKNSETIILLFGGKGSGNLGWIFCLALPDTVPACRVGGAPRRQESKQDTPFPGVLASSSIFCLIVKGWSF